MSAIVGEHIPAEIRAVPRWVVWKEEDVGRPKLTKVPYRPATKPIYTVKADSTDPSTWGTFEDALDSAMRYQRAGGHPKGWRYGIGFVLGDGWAGSDLDDCVDPETGNVEPWAMEIVMELDSYTEISVSGAGLHTLMRGELPPGRRRKGKIELYSESRYFTVSGNRLLDQLASIEDRTVALAQLHARIFPPESNGNGAERPPPLDLSDQELVDRALAASNGSRFQRLWNGELGDYDGDHSAADQALCNLLAFWCGRDPGRMDRLFRSSGLMRKKWEREDYRQRTIDNAIASCRETYTPRRTHADKSAPRTGKANGHADPVASDADNSAEPEDVDAGERDLTHDGLALELGDRWPDARYVDAWGRWLFNVGSHWKTDETLLHLTRCRAVLREIAEKLEEKADSTTNEKHAENLRRSAKTLRSASTVSSVVTLARSNTRQAAEIEQWDRNHLHMGTPNRRSQ